MTQPKHKYFKQKFVVQKMEQQGLQEFLCMLEAIINFMSKCRKLLVKNLSIFGSKSNILQALKDM